MNGVVTVAIKGIVIDQNSRHVIMSVIAAIGIRNELIADDGDVAVLGVEAVVVAVEGAVRDVDGAGSGINAIVVIADEGVGDVQYAGICLNARIGRCAVVLNSAVADSDNGIAIGVDGSVGLMISSRAIIANGNMVQGKVAAIGVEAALQTARIGTRDCVAITTITNGGVDEGGAAVGEGVDTQPIPLSWRGGIAIIVGVAANSIVLERGKVDRVGRCSLDGQAAMDVDAVRSVLELEDGVGVNQESGRNVSIVLGH